MQTPQKLNSYAYVQNNPLNWTDSFGLDSLTTRVLAYIAQGNFAEAAALASAGGMRIASQLQQLPSTLARLINRYPAASYSCDKLATKISDAFKAVGANPRIITITDKYGAVNFYTDKYVQFAQTGFHQAVKVGDRVYDALTGPAGMQMAQYVNMLKSYGIIPKIK